MSDLVFPIGQYLGGAEPDDTAGHYVYRGGTAEHLDTAGLTAWTLAHGPLDPILAAGVRWTRDQLVRYAGYAGLDEPAKVVADLVARELLAETPDAGPAAQAFAREHRAVPLMLGLGNSGEEPHRFTIGFIGRGVVDVDETVYELWAWSATAGTLWDVCRTHAERRLSTVAGAGPADVLGHLLVNLHDLMSAHTLYLDSA